MVDERYPPQALIETPPMDMIVPDLGLAPPPPVKVIRSEDLRQIGNHLDQRFRQYVSDRRIAELKWLRNLRQYLGLYDPEIEKELSPARSKAYPRVTRVKCIAMLARIMNLMFPGNERNWALDASPSPDLPPMRVMAAIQEAMQKNAEAGINTPPDEEMIEAAIKRIADEDAEEFSKLIDDQLQEIGGDQTVDYINLTRKVLSSGIMYGLGILVGPYVREGQTTRWTFDPYSGMPMPQTMPLFKPVLEFLPVWDYYPDMAAKTLQSGDGHFLRRVMSRAQVRKLKERVGFLADQIDGYLRDNNGGNYKAQPFETELRAMGVKVNVNEQKPDATKYEIIIWNGPLSARFLQMAGVEIEPGMEGDDIDAEVWMLGGRIIKCDINEWRKLGMDLRTVHTFIFDEDDTAPIGNGLPNVMRDSQMMISAATRMLLDNASIVCGPNLELNTDLLRMDQDLTSTSAYKIWYREGMGPDANVPAVRNLTIDSHIDELLKIVELGMKMADMETFINPMNGGEGNKMPSEPMRTAAGASMLRGQEALPFKDVIRNFDSFTQSVIQSLVEFNRKFNEALTPQGDFNVIARGATSLIAKELRGMQADQLATSLTPAEAKHIDERKLLKTRLSVRDMDDILIPLDEAKRREQAEAQEMQAQRESQREMQEAQIRTEYSNAYKNIAQGQKNSANADAATINAALDIMEAGANDDAGETEAADGNDPVAQGPSGIPGA